MLPKQALTGASWAYNLGFISSLVVTLAGVVYFLVLVGSLIAGQLTFPPAEGIQLFAGIISLIMCPSLVLVMASLHTITDENKRVLSLVSLGFTLLFALAVSINRFSQLGVVRQAASVGRVEGISWFLAYGGRLFHHAWIRIPGLGLVFRFGHALRSAIIFQWKY